MFDPGDKVQERGTFRLGQVISARGFHLWVRWEGGRVGVANAGQVVLLNGPEPKERVMSEEAQEVLNHILNKVYHDTGEPPSEKALLRMNIALREMIGEENRLACLRLIWGDVHSSKELTKKQVNAMNDWLDETRCRRDWLILNREYLINLGQLVLPGMR